MGILRNEKSEIEEGEKTLQCWVVHFNFLKNPTLHFPPPINPGFPTFSPRMLG